ALQAGGDHVVDGVAAGTADAEHGDARLELTDVGDSQIDGHLLASSFMRGRRRRPAPADPPPAVVMSRVTSRLRIWGPSETLAKPLSDAGEIAARASHQVPLTACFEVLEMRRLRVDEESGRHGKGCA